MADEFLFTVAGASATAAEPISLAEAGLKERAHLQEWVIAHPEILGAGVKVVTFEFDRWSASSGQALQDRLDVLGLGQDGRLIVAELKRDKAPQTTEMQAVKYAAMASRFTVEALADHYARFRNNGMSSEEALKELQGHAPDMSVETLRQPRIVLLAREYPMAVTASVVWLCESGLDITLMQFSAYRAGVPCVDGVTHSQVLVSVSQLYPVRDVEDFMVSPARNQALEPGRSWDEQSYLQEAQARLSQAEAAFVKQLVDDVHARGIKHGWGRWGTPGVSGHYSVAGADTTVWIMNISKAQLEFRLLWIAKSLQAAGEDYGRIEKAAGILGDFASDKFEAAAERGWKSSVLLRLSEVVPEHTEDVMEAIGVLIDPHP